MSEEVKIKIQRVFKGENLNYTVGICRELRTYVMEVVDTTGFIMSENSADKEHIATALFGITAEEFAYKDGNVRKLDDLAFELMHNVPKDRLIAEFYVRKNDRAETIDDGKYVAARKEGTNFPSEVQAGAGEGGKQGRIQIKRVYSNPSLGYHVGACAAMKALTMEVIDTDGRIGIRGEDTGKPGVVIFGLTKDEFDLHKKDTAGLDGVFKKLSSSLPKDRILMEMNARKDKREDSIDNGAFVSAKEESAAAANAVIAATLLNDMMRNGGAWLMTFDGVGKDIPAVDSTNAVQIFSKEEYANGIVSGAKEVPLKAVKLSDKELMTLMQNLFRYGIQTIRIDMGCAESAVADRDSISSLGNVKGRGLCNSTLCFYAIRYLQAARLKGVKESAYAAATFWNAMCKEFGKTVFFVPMCFAGEEKTVKDEGELYFSAGAAEVATVTKPVFFGIEKHKPAKQGMKSAKFLTLMSTENGGKHFFPIFTDIAELKMTFGDKARISIISYEDLKNNSKSCDAVVLNPASLNMVITEKGLESIEKEKDGPVKVFRPQPQNGGNSPDGKIS